MESTSNQPPFFSCLSWHNTKIVLKGPVPRKAPPKIFDLRGDPGCGEDSAFPYACSPWATLEQSTHLNVEAYSAAQGNVHAGVGVVLEQYTHFRHTDRQPSCCEQTSVPKAAERPNGKKKSME